MKKCCLLAVAVMLFVACGASRGSEQKEVDAVMGNEVFVPSFSGDSAYSYVRRQCAFGPRVPGTDAHGDCLRYYVDFFTANNADTVIVQQGSAMLYDGSNMPLYNVIVSYNSAARKRVMLCAHWDSRPYADNDPDEALHRTAIDGANDGASGVGVLMELARLMGADVPEIGVDIVLFDLEDWGAPYWAEKTMGDEWCLGSMYWASHPHEPGYSADYAVLLDMVGDPNAKFYREYFSDRYASWVVDKIWSRAAQLGLSQRFVDSRGGAVTDDHLPVNQIMGIPCIDVIHHEPASPTGFTAVWHTQKDRVENVSAATLQDVGNVLVDVIYRR